MTLGDGIAVGSSVLAAALLVANGSTWAAGALMVYGIWCTIIAVTCSHKG